MIRTYLSKIPLILSLILLGCKGSIDDVKEDQKKIKEPIGVNCDYTFDPDGNRTGKYNCYYPNGKNWISGTLKNDSLNICEQIVYYPSGNIKQYSFYNPLGELRFRQSYSKNGKILKRAGTFLSHEELSRSHLFVGDSIILKIFVATPPGVSYKIYGVDSDGRYEMSFEKTNKAYFQKRVIYGTEAGDFILPYEVEIIDSIRDMKKNLASDVSFKVMEKPR